VGWASQAHPTRHAITIINTVSANIDLNALFATLAINGTLVSVRAARPIRPPLTDRRADQEAYGRVLALDVRYRFVIDTATL
jgi:D-arabinose 1-dehydrogenase-like Zn-dependent alcohol dehydrogenase